MSCKITFPGFQKFHNANLGDICTYSIVYEHNPSAPKILLLTGTLDIEGNIFAVTQDSFSKYLEVQVDTNLLAIGDNKGTLRLNFNNGDSVSLDYTIRVK